MTISPMARVVQPACNPGVDDAADLEPVDHGLGADSGVYFADSALGNNDRFALKGPFVKGHARGLCCLFV